MKIAILIKEIEQGKTMSRKVVFYMRNLPDMQYVVNCKSNSGACPAVYYMGMFGIKYSCHVTKNQKNIALNMPAKKAQNSLALRRLKLVCGSCRNSKTK